MNEKKRSQLLFNDKDSAPPRKRGSFAKQRAISIASAVKKVQFTSQQTHTLELTPASSELAPN